MTESENRRLPRVPKKIRIGIRELRYPLPEDMEAEAEGKDISGDGISFTTSMEFAHGTILALTIELTGWQRHRKKPRIKTGRRRGKRSPDGHRQGGLVRTRRRGSWI